MMKKGKENCERWECILAALEARQEQLGEVLYGYIYDILWRNCLSGRIKRVFHKDQCLNSNKYVARVIKLYTEENTIIQQLVHKPEIEAWQALRKELYTVAYKFLRQRTALPYEKCKLLADDCTQEALSAIYQQRYTFDSLSFSAWARRITQNKCLNAIRSAMTGGEKLITLAEIFDEHNISHQISLESYEEQLITADLTQERVDLLARIQAQLSIEQYDLLYARFVEERRLTDLAVEFDVAPTTIMRRINRTIKQVNANF